jgi:DNA topoisomerase-1
MKYCMKSLKHNGVYIPQYDVKDLSIIIQGQRVKLRAKTEQMAIFWVKKKQSVTSPPDRLFYRNFIQDFLEALQAENPSLKLLQNFTSEYLNSLDKDCAEASLNQELVDDHEIDFSEVSEYLLQEQKKKEMMTKEEKKKLAVERKMKREALKEKYGHAVVDDKKLEVANWTAEPSCIFAGRGEHPKRGKWKQGPKQEDIILNLSKDSARPDGNWKDVVWEPEKTYIAKWEDKLSGKIKYVWFSDSAFLKQKMEKEKFKKAEKLDKQIPRIEAHILENLDSKDIERKKIATVCWLILGVNLRVGDEKDPGEADTVGAITLRPEHINIEGDVLNFDFLGKDSVRWVKQVEAPPLVARNIESFSRAGKEYLFEGINSRKVSRFLSEKMEELTAKVFRTWRCSKTVNEYLKKCTVKKEDEIYVKQFCAKMANLEAAKVANHKRKIPQNFDERVAKKKARVRELEAKLKEKREEGKKTDAARRSLERAELNAKLAEETKEYNLGTSLKSYIDPMVYVRWADLVDFSLDKLYPKTLRKKFSWALEGKCEV